ncbi:hypothetical protein DASC09_061070 [Saccharomycopsis crataegensis]|uniref:General transcription and DNA repair factor IIH subunit TFB5 n=1 Tax=Saccharomycopsis crataegensis TaxID=43959 RepID=A0AAV5QV88_9ASCO|nr:hypothetical protein DASC09_061070 [Saccharomycopsis crataegensis]
MVKAVGGYLIKCDPSIKSIIISIDAIVHDILIEDLDDSTLLINPGKVEYVKNELNMILESNFFDPLTEN